MDLGYIRCGCLPVALFAVMSLTAGCQPDSNAASASGPASEPDTVRLLEQASFGPSEVSVSEVRAKGYARWIEDQFSEPASTLGQYPDTNVDPKINCAAGAAPYCHRDNFSPFPVQQRFFLNALTGRDQLRQRVAFALSQTLVISAMDLSNDIRQPIALATYQQILLDHAFGNFRDLLTEITLNPSMGEYLDMVDNVSTDGTREPNENFARELLQLFTIGVNQLESTGASRTDASGRPLPAYDQAGIEGFTRAFTGWTYPPSARPTTANGHNPRYYKGRMVPMPGAHDTTAKSLLNGTLLPANQSHEQDLHGALDNVFRHANVGPFIGQRLIQHLVTSNPSPAYVARVAAAFNNNGLGVRGDMKAVIRAILLDPEARGDRKDDPAYGRLREPVHFMLGLLRALGATSDGVFLIAQAGGMGQGVYNAASVFNSYPAEYPLPGSTLSSPVSAILSAPTGLARINFANALLYTAGGIAADATVKDAIGTRVNLDPIVPYAADTDKLLTHLDRLLLHGTLNVETRAILREALDAIPADNPYDRIRTAIYLIAVSPEYQVQR